MKIEISKAYEGIKLTTIAQHIDDEIEYHELSHKCKPKRIVIAPFHEWGMHKEGKNVMVISLMEEHTK